MSVCDVPAIQAVCAIGQGVAAVVTAPFDWLAQAMGGAAAWLFQGVWWLFDSTTLVDVTRPEFIATYNVLFGVAIFLTLLFFCLQLVTGMIRRDPAALPRAGLGMARAIIGSFLVVTVTGLLLQIVDQLTTGIVNAAGSSMQQMGDKLAALASGLTLISLPAPGVGAIVTIFLAGLMIAATMMIWFSLLIRKALLLVAIVLAPIAFSGSAWEVTRGWFGKWASFVIALAISKLIVVVIFLVAISQLSAPIDLDLSSISEPVAGIVLLLVGSFAPYLAYKLVSFIGFDMYHAMSVEQEAKQATNRPVPVPHAPRLDTAQRILGNGGGGAAPPGTGGSGGGGTGGTAGSGAPAGAGVSAAGGGTAAGASGGAAAGGGAAGGAAGAGAAAGPVGLAVAGGAAIVKGAAEAGPRLGGAVAGAADREMTSAQATSSPAPTGAQFSPGAPTPSTTSQSPPLPSPPASSPAGPSRPVGQAGRPATGSPPKSPDTSPTPKE